jgi:hypothetical protein
VSDDVSTSALRNRVNGHARTGTITLRDFDKGVVETLGAKVIGDRYFITELKHLDPAPEFPGVPVVFAHPEDVFQAHKVPVIEVRRDDIQPAMNRWHPGTLHYRVPSASAQPATVTFPDGTYRSGYTHYETLQQSCPFDLLYTINIIAKQRQYMAAANLILAYVLKIYQPYCSVYAYDSIGDLRSYEAFLESVGPMDEAADVSERMIGFALSLRVEAELDINDPKVQTAVSKLARVRVSVIW